MTRRFLCPRAGRLWRDESGVSVVELALVAPVLALLIMGMTDLARGLAARHNLEQAAYRVLEKVAVGSVQSDYTTLAPEAASAAGAGATASIDQWLECDGTRQPSFDGVCPDGQTPARYVRVTVNQNFAPSFSYSRATWKFLNLTNGVIPLSGTAALRVQ